MKFNAVKVLVVLLGLFIFSDSYSDAVYIYIDDMSKVKYQLVGDGKVYFRNLNEFRSPLEVTGCCYAFYLDTTTDFGRSAWSLMLAKMAMAKPLNVYVTNHNPPTSGNAARIDHLGNW
jgi:hypothetical protein